MHQESNTQWMTMSKGHFYKAGHVPKEWVNQAKYAYQVYDSSIAMNTIMTRKLKIIDQ